MNVVLISRDQRLGAILTMALSAAEELTVLDSATEVPDQPEIDAVVLDLPADSRRDAYEELRQRYEGRVVVPVDNARDTSGWPPDAKRCFLVRPFQVADLIAGVQEPQETSVAERAATYRRRLRWNRHQTPTFPLAGLPPEADDPTAAPPPPAATPEPAAAEPAAAEPAADQQEAAMPEPEGPSEAEAAAEVDDDAATVEFVREAAEGEAAPEEGEAAGEEADDHPEAEAEADAGTEGDAEAAPDLDEALIAELEQLVLAESGEGGEAAAERPPEAAEDVPAQEELPPRPLPVQAGVAMAEAVALQQWLEAEEVKRARRRRRLILANVVAGLVLLLAGVVTGRAISPEPAPSASPPATPPQPASVRTAPPPAACSAAMDNADQVISYLVAKIRDERLSKSIQEYAANARACRTTGR